MSFYAKDLIITNSTSPRDFAHPSDLPANSSSDHMVEIDWTAEKGWTTPEIKPYSPLTLDPTASCLHYATQCFEGMKLFRSTDGKSLRLLRPELNIERLKTSCERGALPTFDVNELVEIIKKFAAVDGRYVAPGKFVYLRPYVIGTNPGLGVKIPSSAKLGVVMTMMPVWSTRPLKLATSKEDEVRAWPGGFGSSKLGANYGPTIVKSTLAAQKGYDQVLWLFGDNRVVTEAGACNFFIVWDSVSDADTIEILTCSLDKGLILPGINRRNALEYLRAKEAAGERINGKKIHVVEREFTISELAQASKDGRLRESFAIGTALFVTPVGEILLPGDETLEIPVSDEGVVKVLQTKFESCMYGDYEKPNDWVVEIEL